MMRSLSSCLDVTRIWRRTDRASLEKKPSTRLSHEPCLGVKVNPLNAALDGLMMHTQSMSYRKERGVSPVRQQHPCPLDPARRLRSRPRYRNQPRHIFISDRQFNRLPPCCHDLQPRPCESEARVQAVMDHV